MKSALPPEISRILTTLEPDRPVVWLTGAGISAESGIPTFRGPEGYWTIGTRNYQPTELATWEAFSRMPDEIWAWYLYRRAICRRAEPNAAHRALAEQEQRLGDRFRLVTQNVDGLHLRAGNSRDRTWQIHGNLDVVRCAEACDLAPWPLPAAVSEEWPRERQLDEETRSLLRCPHGCRARPHVLWFDECYDEKHFHFDSSLAISSRAAVLIVVGTSGATSLPMQMARTAAASGVPIVVVDPDPHPFAEIAARSGGAVLAGTAGNWIPRIGEEIS